MSAASVPRQYLPVLSMVIAAVCADYFAISQMWPAGIAEAGGSDAPGSVDRAVEQLHAAGRQLRALRVDVVDLEGELHAGSGFRRRDHGRLDELGRLGRLAAG